MRGVGGSVVHCARTRCPSADLLQALFMMRAELGLASTRNGGRWKYTKLPAGVIYSKDELNAGNPVCLVQGGPPRCYANIESTLCYAVLFRK